MCRISHNVHLLLSHWWVQKVHTLKQFHTHSHLCPFQLSTALYIPSWHSLGVWHFQAKDRETYTSKITWHESLFKYLLECLFCFIFHWDQTITWMWHFLLNTQPPLSPLEWCCWWKTRKSPVVFAGKQEQQRITAPVHVGNITQQRWFAS